MQQDFKRRRGRRSAVANTPATTGDLFAAPARTSPKAKVPDIVVKLGEPRPSSIFDTYWRFAAERQAIFFNKIRRPNRPPWTHDPLLQVHKFTNAYRASDRVSQYLIRNVIYVDDASLRTPEEIFFRTILFKIFNKIETWELLLQAFGTIRWADYDFPRYNAVLTRSMESGQRIYSAAYIMASGQSAFGHPRKHSNHLCMLQRMMEDRLPARLHQEQPSLAKVYEKILAYPSIGKFLAYQYAIDLNYGTLLEDASEDDFVMPGPGAYDGLAKCFSDLGDYGPADAIRWTKDRQQDDFARLGLDFLDLWGRPLTLIDCQNLFCEVDKYARKAHPEARGLSNRTRIKQMYKPTPGDIRYWYPPKWGLNDIIAADPGYERHDAPILR